MNSPYNIFSFQTAISYPDLALAAMGKKINKPFRNVVEFKSLNKLNFISFAKSELFGQDLYSELVAPNLQTGKSNF